MNADSGWIFSHGALVTDAFYADPILGGAGARQDGGGSLAAAFLHYSPIPTWR